MSDLPWIIVKEDNKVLSDVLHVIEVECEFYLVVWTRKSGNFLRKWYTIDWDKDFEMKQVTRYLCLNEGV